jgi:protocatechuate 3,4-dioxygenase beta subunit
MTRSETTRRQALGALGAGAAVFVLGCGDDASDTKTTGSAATPTAASGSGTGTCVLSPEVTEGPYYLADQMIRQDITEGRPGVPLELRLTVQDASSCEAIGDATVEIWHADAQGTYSGVDGDTGTHLRGGQKSDADGGVTFKTIYPGWYPGRTAHIHLKVHISGSEVHTGQLFFDDSVSSRVFADGDYGRGDQDVSGDQDGIRQQAGDASTLALTKSGDGYVGKLTLGVRTA